MKSHNDFLDAIDDAAVVAAIAAAERLTSAELRVFVSHFRAPDAIAAARKQFSRLKMHRTKHRNAVLIFVAPTSRAFAVVADLAANEKCGQPTWDRLAGELATHFRDQKFTEGLVHVISELGRTLPIHFPPDADAKNELPDQIERD